MNLSFDTARCGYILTAFLTVHVLHSLSALSITFSFNDGLTALFSCQLHFIPSVSSPEMTLLPLILGQLVFLLIFIFHGTNSFIVMLLQENKFKAERKLGKFVTVCWVKGALWNLCIFLSFE